MESAIDSKSNALPMEKLQAIFRLPLYEWDEQFLPIMEEWNKQNTPPLSSQELEDVVWNVRAEAIRNRQMTPPGKEIGEAIKIDELLKTPFPEARFTIEHLFEAGTINMLSAPPNKWKSWVVLHAALSVASGESLFGKFETEKMPVMIINEEDTPRLLQERCVMLMGDAKDLPIYFYIGKEIKLTDEYIGKLLAAAQEKRVGFMIFDSLRTVHQADENNSQEMQKIMDQLKRITRTGITVLFTHHNRKKFRMGGGGKDDSGEESRGSSAINAAVQGHISCDETERDEKKYLVIYQPKLKADEKLKPFEVQILHDKQSDKMHFVYDGDHKDRERLETKTMRAIEQYIEASSVWIGVKDLVDEKLGGGTVVRAALKLLQRGGVIQSLERKQVIERGLPVGNEKGAPNENLYFRSVLVDALKNQSELSLGP